MERTIRIQHGIPSGRGPARPAAIDDPPSAGLRARASRHPVTAFLLLLFSVGYPVMSLVIMADHGVIPGGGLSQSLGIGAERLAALALVLLVLLPAALWTTWAGDGPEGVRALLRRTFRWRFPPRWWLFVLAGLPALTIAFTLLLGDTLRPIDMVPFAVEQTVGLLVGLILVNLWEETAWAGFLQTRLEQRHNLVMAAVLTAVPFALIHMPLQFIGEFSAGSLAAALMLLLIVSVVFRLLLGVVLRGARDSVLAVALLHTMFNRSNNGDGIVAALVDGPGRGLAALSATAVLATVVAVVIRRRLTRSYRLDHLRSR
jgi:membrane protease YdiL (CAAX protease family)